MQSNNSDIMKETKNSEYL